MNEKTKKQHDEIDLELTKIYFGGASRETHSKNEQPAAGKTGGKTESSSHPPVKAGRSTRRSLMLIPVILAVLLAGVILGFRFLARKKIVFKVNIRDIVTPKKDVYRYYDVTGAVKSADLSAGRVLYDFEKSEDSWAIPGWAAEKPDHVAAKFQAVKGVSANGEGSLEVSADFPGGRWTAALVEISHFLDLGKYQAISADIFLPPDAPEGLQAKIILTVGDTWRFVEMVRSVKLVPGKWITVAASIADGSTDWKRTAVDGFFRKDVRKIALRVESNRKPAYTGPFYLDNVRIYEASE